jgi:hypothetical protein
MPSEIGAAVSRDGCQMHAYFSVKRKKRTLRIAKTVDRCENRNLMALCRVTDAVYPVA